MILTFGIFPCLLKTLQYVRPQIHSYMQTSLNSRLTCICALDFSPRMSYTGKQVQIVLVFLSNPSLSLLLQGAVNVYSFSGLPGRGHSFEEDLTFLIKLHYLIAPHCSCPKKYIQPPHKITFLFLIFSPFLATKKP